MVHLGGRTHFPTSAHRLGDLAFRAMRQVRPEAAIRELDAEDEIESVLDAPASDPVLHAKLDQISARQDVIEEMLKVLLSR